MLNLSRSRNLIRLAVRHARGEVALAAARRRLERANARLESSVVNQPKRRSSCFESGR